MIKYEIKVVNGIAVFKNYLGTSFGFMMAFLVLFIWAFVPFYLSLRIFKKKDL